MSRFTYESTIQAPAALVFDWHHDPGVLEKLTPPWEPVSLVGRPARIDQNGSRATLKIALLGLFPVYWVAEHRNYQAGKSFQDIQIKGPFARWCHTHSVESLTEDSCKYIDQIDYALPAGALGELLGGWLVRKKLTKMFAYRHQVVKTECERLAATSSAEVGSC
jgi:ligand-binding SRPBCC domain-containing protein